MKLFIETWIEETHQFDGVALELFIESVKCYKAGAYRSSFLMSYLAFGQTIKERILNYSGKPKDVEEGYWNKIRKSLQNDETWEKMINEIIYIAPPKKDRNEEEIYDKTDKRIFRLSNHYEIVDELKNYKNKRNVCAHSKSGTIDSSLVECFWNFLRDNICKFHVNGNEEYFKESIFKAFRDRYETTLELSYKDYIDMIRYSGFKENELIGIWEFLYENIKKLSNNKKEEERNFWKYIFINTESLIKESFISFVKKDKARFIKFYELIPEILGYIMNQSDAHIFKKEFLYLWFDNYIKDNNDIIWDLVRELLCKRYIPIGDEDMFFEHINIYDLENNPDEELTSLLKERGFFEFSGLKYKFRNYIKYDFDNNFKQRSKIEITKYILKNVEMDRQIIIEFNEYIEQLYKRKSRDSKEAPILARIFNELDLLLQSDEEFFNRLLEKAKEFDVTLNYNIIKYMKVPVMDFDE